MQKGDLRELMGRSSSIESGKRKALFLISAELSVFGSSIIAEETKNTFSVLSSRGLKALSIFILHKTNVQGFNSNQSYLKKI